jgi:hypothetical protein
VLQTALEAPVDIGPFLQEAADILHQVLIYNI